MKHRNFHLALIPGEGVFVLHIEQHPFGHLATRSYMLSNIHGSPDDRAYYGTGHETYEEAYEHAKALVERHDGEVLDPQDVTEFFSKFWPEMPPA